MFLINVISHVVLFSGGKVLFDEKDVELKSENILIVGGGILQVIWLSTTDQIVFSCICQLSINLICKPAHISAIQHKCD